MYKPDGSAGVDPANALIMGLICPTCQCDRVARMSYAGVAGGNNSRMACQWCCLNGSSVAGAVRPCGYVEEVLATQGKLAGEKILIGRDEERRQISHEEQEARAEHMQERGKRCVVSASRLHGGSTCKLVATHLGCLAYSGVSSSLCSLSLGYSRLAPVQCFSSSGLASIAVGRLLCSQPRGQWQMCMSLRVRLSASTLCKLSQRPCRCRGKH